MVLLCSLAVFRSKPIASLGSSGHGAFYISPKPNSQWFSYVTFFPVGENKIVVWVVGWFF